MDAGVEHNYFDPVKDVDVPSVQQQKGGTCMDHIFVSLRDQPW